MLGQDILLSGAEGACERNINGLGESDKGNRGDGIGFLENRMGK